MGRWGGASSDSARSGMTSHELDIDDAVAGGQEGIKGFFMRMGFSGKEARKRSREALMFGAMIAAVIALATTVN